jgi:23S rRNA (cytosine1962-C5)-methyltransferase
VAERDEAHVRELEGLPLRTGILDGSVPEGGIIIKENGLPFFVDLMGGQKTGHFLDQKENRPSLRASLPAAACWTPAATPAASAFTPPQPGPGR